MGTIKYKIKMYAPEFVPLIVLIPILICFYSTTSQVVAWIMILLLILDFFVALKKPKHFYVKRLNNYFVVFYYPVTKWRGIYQKAEIKQRIHSSGVKECRMLFKDLSDNMISMFDYLDKEQGYYRTITHDTLKDRLFDMQAKGKIHILTCQPAYEHNLIKIQRKLFHNKCRKCSFVHDCKFWKLAKEKRVFYFIEFQII